MSAPFDAVLRGHRLLITAGSGGVGKTTTAAALAVRAAQIGLRAAVLTIDPARRLADALGLGALTGELRPVDLTALGAPGATGALSAMMLDVKTTSDQMVRRFAPDAAAAQAILDNTYYRYFSTSLAGAQEYMAVEQVRMLVDEGGFDLVVLDTPPAAHALEFLDAPDRLLGALESRPMQMLRARRQSDGLAARLARSSRGLVIKGLNRLTGGPFIDQLAEFLTAFGSILDALKVSSAQVHARLRADTTRFLLVTSPARSNIDEAVAFRSQLEARGFPLGGIIVNRVHGGLPMVPDDPDTTAALRAAMTAGGLGDRPPARRVALLDEMRRTLTMHARLTDRDQAAIGGLQAASGAPIWTIPLFTSEVRDLAALEAVARALTPHSPTLEA